MDGGRADTQEQAIGRPPWTAGVPIRRSKPSAATAGEHRLRFRISPRVPAAAGSSGEITGSLVQAMEVSVSTGGRKRNAAQRFMLRQLLRDVVAPALPTLTAAADSKPSSLKS
jgi:hypothetical protein